MERNTLEVKKNSRRIKINQSPGTFQETPEWCPWGILDASVWMRLARARYSSHVQSRVVVRHSDDKIEQAAVHCEVPAHFNPRHDNSLDNSSCPFSTLSLSSLSLPFSLLPFPQPFLQFLVHLAFTGGCPVVCVLLVLFHRHQASQPSPWQIDRRKLHSTDLAAFCVHLPISPVAPIVSR